MGASDSDMMTAKRETEEQAASESQVQVEDC